MQKLAVNFYQRVMLTQIVGTHPAPTLKESSVYLRLLEKMRLTDTEQLDTKFTSDGPRILWNLPHPEYGNRELELEHEEAKALITAMEASTTPVRVIDAEWMTKIVMELEFGQPAKAEVV